VDSTYLVAQVFVYGTLKRGECRERSWLRRPLAVEAAWTLGRLYDLGPYPALVEGTDRVLGELWRFVPEDMDETLRVLDGIEGFDDQPHDFYRREVVECTTEAGIVVSAFTYVYARPLPDGARLLTANASGFSVWP
jgi:gamma-glutamylcyclotransferase (GGCT)/AIG2-like uncharacterized protein YtfP